MAQATAENASSKGLATSNLKGCGGKLIAKQKIHFKIPYISIPIGDTLSS